MSRVPLLLPSILLAAAGMQAGCKATQSAERADYQMGEKATAGPLTYTVIESVWRSQLGSGFNIRVPERRFLLMTVSVSNHASHDISVPLLTMENQNGQSFTESNNGEGVDNWFGLLRTIGPSQTQQGKILFDAPLSSYRLRLTDGGETETGKYAWVNIPLRLDGDSEVGLPPADGIDGVK